MGQFSERDIAEFAVDLTKRLCDIDEEYFEELSMDWELRWGKFNIKLGDIHDRRYTADELLEYAADVKDDPEETDVKEFTDDEHCVAYLAIEGDLYEKAYYSESCGAGGEEATKYLNALNDAAEAHNMRYDWAGGAIKLYDRNDHDAGIIGKL